jgi:hypothetical protein
VDSENAVIGKSYTVGVAAEVVEDDVRSQRAFSRRRFTLLAQGFRFIIAGCDFFGPCSALTMPRTFPETHDSEL